MNTFEELKELIGRKVTAIAEDNSNGDYWLGLVFTGRKVAWISRDDEGNAPGTLHIEPLET